MARCAGKAVVTGTRRPVQRRLVAGGPSDLSGGLFLPCAASLRSPLLGSVSLQRVALPAFACAPSTLRHGAIAVA